MPDAHANFAYSTVLTAPSPAPSGTTVVVQSSDGAKFPAAPFNCVICPSGVAPTTANAEVVRVTVVATDTFTITRAQESSSARTVVVGDQIYAAFTAKTATDIETLGVGGDLTGNLPNPTFSTQGLQKFPQLASAGTKKIAFGNANVVWTASANATTTTVTHGLGTTPTVIVVTPQIQHGFGGTLAMGWNTAGSTTFAIDATLSVSTSVTIPCSWIAIG